MRGMVEMVVCILTPMVKSMAETHVREHGGRILLERVPRKCCGNITVDGQDRPELGLYDLLGRSEHPSKCIYKKQATSISQAPLYLYRTVKEGGWWVVGSNIGAKPNNGSLFVRSKAEYPDQVIINAITLLESKTCDMR
jgi:hypothetical protein